MGVWSYRTQDTDAAMDAVGIFVDKFPNSEHTCEQMHPCGHGSREPGCALTNEWASYCMCSLREPTDDAVRAYARCSAAPGQYARFFTRTSEHSIDKRMTMTTPWHAGDSLHASS